MKNKHLITKNNNIKLLFGVVLVLLICILSEVLSNIPVLKLSASERGMQELEPSRVVVEGFTEKNNEYVLEESVETGSIRWEFDTCYIKKIQYKKVCEGLFDAQIIVDTYDAYGNLSQESFDDNSPVLIPLSTVNINRCCSAITITASQGVMTGERCPVVIGSPVIINRAQINWMRVCIIFLLGMMLILLILFSGFFVEKIENGFVLIAFVTGISILLCFPSIKVGWDEEAHLRAAYRLTALIKAETLPNEIYSQMVGAEYGWPLNLPGSAEETQLLDEIQNDIYLNAPDDMVFEGRTRGFATAGTINMAAAIAVARAMNLPWSGIYFWGRFVNLLTYIVTVYLAIKLMPVGKRILTYISLMPTSIFLAVCFTYDVVVYGFIVLGMAVIMREWIGVERKIDLRMLCLGAALIMWGCLSKQVYAPMVLLVLLIPNERYKMPRQGKILKLLAVGGMLMLFVTLLVLVLMGQYGTGDYRGGAVDNGMQMQLILAHPIAFSSILIQNICGTLYSYMFGPSVYQSMGHLPMAGCEHIITIGAFATLLIDDGGKEKIGRFARIGMWFIAIVIIGLIWSALYVQYNPVGAVIIGGVQARYYRPIIPLIYLLISNYLNRIVKVNINDKWKNEITIAISAFVMCLTTIQIMNLFRI